MSKLDVCMYLHNHLIICHLATMPKGHYVFSPIVVSPSGVFPTSPSPTIYSFPDHSIDVYIYPDLQLPRPVSK